MITNEMQLNAGLMLYYISSFSFEEFHINSFDGFSYKICKNVQYNAACYRCNYYRIFFIQKYDQLIIESNAEHCSVTITEIMSCVL